MTPRRIAPARALCAGLLSLLLGGCARETQFEYPEFEQWSAFAVPGDCASAVLELRRVDAVRWSMREDGVRIRDESLRKAAKIGLFALLAGAELAAGVPPTPPYGPGDQHSRAHTLEQADRRLVRLLQRKRALGCPPEPTARSAISDMDLLDRIEELNRRHKSGAISDREEVEERSRLLEDLGASGRRDVAPAGAVPGAPGQDEQR